MHGNKMRAALTMDVLATDLADYLVRKGVRFSQTGTQSPRLVRSLVHRYPFERRITFLDVQWP